MNFLNFLYTEQRFAAGTELYFSSISPHVKKKKKKCDAAFEALHNRATRTFQHIYLMYANDLAVLNEGTINHYNDPLKKTKKTE